MFRIVRHRNGVVGITAQMDDEDSGCWARIGLTKHPSGCRFSEVSGSCDHPDSWIREATVVDELTQDECVQLVEAIKEIKGWD